MINAWIVIRKEKHIDPKHWVCLDREDALVIARDVTKYWVAEYEGYGDVDNTCHADQIFMHQQEDAFTVYVIPTQIRQAGEHRQV